MDPFGVTCDLRLYVPRLGSEAALAALREGFALERGVSVLSGPPGLGKTTVLHLLAARLAPARCVHLPYAALDIEELAHWALALLGEEVQPERATIALAAAARRDPSAPLVLLVDDASALSPVTARALRELVDALSGALRVVAAVVDDSRASVAIAALGDGVLHVRLRHALAASEVRAYVRGRIERAGANELDERLRDEHLEWLAAESAGVPRVVNTLATLLLRQPEGRAPLALTGEAVERPGAQPGATPFATATALDSDDDRSGNDSSAQTRGDHAPPRPRAPLVEAVHALGTEAPLRSLAPRRRRRLRRTRGWY